MPRKGGKKSRDPSQSGGQADGIYIHPGVAGSSAKSSRTAEQVAKSFHQQSLDSVESYHQVPVQHFEHILATKCGTDLKKCREDPYGDGDQSSLTEKYGAPLRELWATGADIMDVVTSGNAHPIIYTCVTGNVKGLREILDETKRTEGQEGLRKVMEQRIGVLRSTPLMACVLGMRSCQPPEEAYGVMEIDHVGCLRTLVEYGARIEARDIAGHTVLHHVAGIMITEKSKRMIRILFDAGADANAQNRMGAVVMHSTLRTMDFDAIQMLLDAGANTDIRDNSGITPWEMSNRFPNLRALFSRYRRKKRQGAAGGASSPSEPLSKEEGAVDISKEYNYVRLKAIYSLQDHGIIDDVEPWISKGMDYVSSLNPNSGLAVDVEFAESQKAERMVEIKKFRKQGQEHAKLKDWKPASRCFQTALNLLFAVLPNQKRISSDEKKLIAEISCELGDANLHFSEKLEEEGLQSGTADYYLREARAACKPLLDSYQQAKLDAKMREDGRVGKYQSVLTVESGRSKRVGPPIPRDQMKPILITEMKLNHTHYGFYLKGRLPEDAFWPGNAGAMLLEDEQNVVERVAIYGLNITSSASIAKMFPAGTRIIIWEPYFKTAADGGTAIRVDNPRDVEILPRDDFGDTLSQNIRRLDRLTREQLERNEKTRRQGGESGGGGGGGRVMAGGSSGSSGSAPAPKEEWLTHLQPQQRGGKNRQAQQRKQKGKAKKKPAPPPAKPKKVVNVLMGYELAERSDLQKWQQVECPVCQENFSNGLANQWVVVLPGCNHLLCVPDLYQMNKRKMLHCPMDRKELDSKFMTEVKQGMTENSILRDVAALLPLTASQRRRVLLELIENRNFDFSFVLETLWEMVTLQCDSSLPEKENEEEQKKEEEVKKEEEGRIVEIPDDESVPRKRTPPITQQSKKPQHRVVEEEEKELSSEEKQSIYAEERAKLQELWGKLKKQKQKIRSLFFRSTGELEEAQEECRKIQTKLMGESERSLTRIFQRMNQGKAVDRGDGRPLEWDFHGLHANEAIKKLQEIVEPVLPILQKVKVITGKGLHSPEGKGVLGDALCKYLDGKKGISWSIVKGNPGAMWIVSGSF